MMPGGGQREDERRQHRERLAEVEREREAGTNTCAS